MIEPQNQRRNDGRAYEKFKPNHFVIALVVSIFRQPRAAAGYLSARCALKNAKPRGRRIWPRRRPSGRAIRNEMRATLRWYRRVRLAKNRYPDKKGSWCFRCVTSVGESTNAMT